MDSCPMRRYHNLNKEMSHLFTSIQLNVDDTSIEHHEFLHLKPGTLYPLIDNVKTITQIPF